MSAVLSPCGAYRYRLDRRADAEGPTVAFIMVNPSTADAENDDPTIRKVLGFAQRLGFGRVIVGNKFAYRATDIGELRSAAAPVGPENDRYLTEIMAEADTVIAAWGPLAKLPPHLRARWQEVAWLADLTGRGLQCLSVAQDGQPRHPLMLAYDTPLTGWALNSP